MLTLPDVQNTRTDDFPKIPINKVGVRNIELPIMFEDAGERIFHGIATVSSYCNLNEKVAGINMSRIGRTLIETCTSLGKTQAKPLLQMIHDSVYALRDAHGAEDIYFKMSFKYPIVDYSPMSAEISPEIVDVVMEATLKKDRYRQYMTVKKVGMSLCPCSKEMSSLMSNLTPEEKYVLTTMTTTKQDVMMNLMKKLHLAGFGAHNQKSFIETKVELIRNEDAMTIKELVDLTDASTSCPTFSILKRPDEKYVTEVSYMSAYIDKKGQVVEVPDGGPKFVEDISRQLADRLNQTLDISITDYCIVVENMESIHSSEISAVAVLTAGRDLV